MIANIKKLLPCLKGYGWYTILTPITVIAESVLEIYIPFLMSLLIDRGINGVANGFFATSEESIAYVWKIGLLMVGLALLSLFFGAVCARFASLSSTGFAKGIRTALFSKVQDFSFSNTDKFSTSSLITRMTTDVTYAQMALMMTTRMMARAPVMMICSMFMVITINARLSTVFLIAIPILGGVLGVIATKAYPLFGKMFKKYDKMNSSVQENLINIRTVKAFVRRDYENDKFVKSATDVRDAQKRAEKLMIMTNPAMQFTMYACMIIIAWFGGKQIVAGGMMSGQLMSFISYVSQILMSLMMIAMGFIMLVTARASIERIAEVIDEQPEITDDGIENDTPLANGSISFKDVCFSYANKKDNLTLTGVNLEIKSGEKIGIIGGTGAAKTTLVQLIPRLYDVYSGSLLVGGLDVRSYKLRTLRDGVAMVLQKNVLFSGTIKDNLRWGNEEATDEEIETACKNACAHEFIISFPDGYDTVLGQGGVNLSGGQKQRLCIARALLKNPKIIILDDSTSAVDTATDAKIRSAFSGDLKGVTAIIIAQRINSVSDCDRIVVLDEGKINGIGTHEQLLEENAIYREVYDSQQKGSVDEEGRETKV